MTSSIAKNFTSEEKIVFFGTDASFIHPVALTVLKKSNIEVFFLATVFQCLNKDFLVQKFYFSDLFFTNCSLLMRNPKKLMAKIHIYLNILNLVGFSKLLNILILCVWKLQCRYNCTDKTDRSRCLFHKSSPWKIFVFCKLWTSHFIYQGFTLVHLIECAEFENLQVIHPNLYFFFVDITISRDVCL